MKKFALYFCLFVLIAGAASMCSDKDADSKKAESAAPAKTLTLADYRTVGLLNEEKVGVIKSFMKKNNLPDSELNSFQTCLVEYANFRDKKEKADDVLGICMNEYKEKPEFFKSHVDLLPFFHEFSPWDGSYRPLERMIKHALNDRDSYKHDTTRFTLDIVDRNAPFAVVRTDFRAKNAFGAMIKASATVKVNIKTLDMEVLETKGI